MRHGGKFEFHYPADIDLLSDAVGDRTGIRHLFKKYSADERLPTPPGEAGETERDRFIELFGRLASQLHAGGSVTGNRHPSLPAGYTYLGQFVVHDMVKTPSMPLTGRPTAIDFKSEMSVSLDLDAVYGDGPDQSTHLYEFVDSSTPRSRLRLGRVNTARQRGQYVPGSADDIPRASFQLFSDRRAGPTQFEPLVGDGRNADNLIVSQLVVLFAKFHNKIADRLENAGEQQIFDTARGIVVESYRRIVLEDFAPRVLDDRIWKKFQAIKSLADLPHSGGGKRYRLPAEAIFAGLRFGHSLVRSRYWFNEHFNSASAKKRAELRDMLDCSGQRGTSRLPMSDTWVIDWARFFDLTADQSAELGMGPDKVNPAHQIGPALAHALGDHRDILSSVSMDGDGERKVAHGLAFRTLLKGLMFGLPTGQALARKLRVPVLDSEAIAARLRARPGPCAWNSAFRPCLGDADIDYLSETTPLFLYVLLEAEICTVGVKLGPLGSWLVAHVLTGARLSRDPELVAGDAASRHGIELPATMADLIRFVG